MTKPRSTLIDGLLTEYGPPDPLRARVAEHPCEGAKFHSPTPLTTRSFTDRGLSVWLCPTCTDKLEIFLHLHDTDAHALTFDVMREFGNAIRLLGQKAVEHG